MQFALSNFDFEGYHPAMKSVMGKRYSPATALLFQGIIDHFWRARQAGTPAEKKLFPSGYAITYGELIRQSNAKILPISAGGYLFHVAAICAENGLPPIHSLVVNSRTGWPARNYKGAPNSGISYAGWERKFSDCLSSEVFPKSVPPIA